MAEQEIKELKAPQGVEFYNIKSGDTHYLRSEPQIQGYINSSDKGVNASRGQDFGWRLGPSWVKKIRQFRKNSTKMELLASRNGGESPTDTQIMFTIYGEQLRKYEQQLEEGDAPFEETYLKNIAKLQ